jgi:hypothetical protein
LLLRGDSLAVGFFTLLKKTFGFRFGHLYSVCDARVGTGPRTQPNHTPPVLSAGECHEFTSHLLYDIMQGTGRADCKQFKSVTGMDATFFNLAAGTSHSSWRTPQRETTPTHAN